MTFAGESCTFASAVELSEQDVMKNFVARLEEDFVKEKKKKNSKLISHSVKGSRLHL